MNQVLSRSLDYRYTNRCVPILIRNLASNASNVSNIGHDKASNEQLYNIEQAIQESVPKFFSKNHPFNHYSKQVIFINNIHGDKCAGLGSYMMRINLIRLYFFTRYSSNVMELLNLVKNHEESYIKVRWRIKSAPVLKGYTGKDTWRDGISTFHVDNQGKICSHVCDNVETDTKETPLVFKRLNHI